EYIEAAQERIAQVEPLDDASLMLMTGKRAEPRVAFSSLIEAGLGQPGTCLYDRHKRWAAYVRADGTIAIGDEAGSIHRIGARIQGLEACNGWTFWHIEVGGALKPIDELRQQARRTLKLVGA